jgi:hypothetical protein
MSHHLSHLLQINPKMQGLIVRYHYEIYGHAEELSVEVCVEYYKIGRTTVCSWVSGEIHWVHLTTKNSQSVAEVRVFF